MSKIDELIQQLCPDGVEYKKIYEVSIVKRGERITKKDIVYNGDYPIISGGVTPMGFYDKYNREANTITISSYGQAGFVDFIQSEFWANDVCLCVFPKDIINNRFLYYCLKNAQKVFYANTTKAIPDHIPTQFILDYEVPVPPMEVQSEIVRILDKFTLLTAELTAELTARKKQYEYYRFSLLKYSSTTQLIQLSELAKFTYGYTNKANNTGTARFIRITDIMEDGCLNPKGAKFINLSEENKKYLLHKGDLLMARTRATYGKTLYFPNDTPAVYASFLIKITLDNSRILNRYYWHFSKSTLYWKQAEKYVSNGGQQQLNANAVSQIVVPVPSLEIQQRIVNVLDNFEKICNDLNIGLPAEIEARKKQYEYYRDKLLTFVDECGKHTHIYLENKDLIAILQYVFGYVSVKIGSYFTKQKGTSITAGEMKNIENSEGDVKIFAGGKTVVTAMLKDIKNARIITKPAVLVQSRGLIDVIYYDKPFTFKNEMWAYTTENQITVKYLFYYVKTKLDVLRNKAGIMGSMPQISLDDTENMIIPMPSLKGQERIVFILDKFDSYCNDLSQGLPAEIEARQKQYEYYRDKLLRFKPLEK